MKVKVTKPTKIVPMNEVAAPFYSPERDGVTFTLLTTFKGCKEKARLVLKGWTSRRSSLGQVFGGLTHGVNQRIYQDVRDGKLNELPSVGYITTVCREVEGIWKVENPRADTETLAHLEYSMILLEALMPMYFKYWKKDFKLFWERVEAEFKWPVVIEHPTAKATKTFIRGKIDGSFGQKKGGPPWLFETKTRAYLGERGESDLADVLPHELQVNIYLLYLRWVDKRMPGGLLYNIIRRPGLSRKKQESQLEFAKRLAADIFKRPEFYFIRMRMDVSAQDLDVNEMELHDLASDFLMWWNGLAGHYKNSDHCITKYGTCGFLGVCARKDFTGLYKRKTVFRELADQL